MPHFDPTVTLGTVFEIIGFILAASGFYWGMVNKVARLELKHDQATETFGKDLTEVKTDVKEIRKDLIGSLDARIRGVELELATMRGAKGQEGGNR